VNKKKSERKRIFFSFFLNTENQKNDGFSFFSFVSKTNEKKEKTLKKKRGRFRFFFIFIFEKKREEKKELLLNPKKNVSLCQLCNFARAPEKLFFFFSFFLSFLKEEKKKRERESFLLERSTLSAHDDANETKWNLAERFKTKPSLSFFDREGDVWSRFFSDGVEGFV